MSPAEHSPNDLYAEIEAVAKVLRAPGQMIDVGGLHAAPGGDTLVFAATFAGSETHEPYSNIYSLDLAEGDLCARSEGPHQDRTPRISPDGAKLAFVSDRAGKDDFQLHILEIATGETFAAPKVEGWIESIAWSPDGSKLLLGVAGYGADLAGRQGAVPSRQSGAGEAWMPSVESGDETFRWRCAWIYDAASNAVERLGFEALNIWELWWCGNAAFVAISSAQPGEESWYGAALRYFELQRVQVSELHAPADQLGALSCSPSGRQVAVVEAVCSDRGNVVGDLYLIDTQTKEKHRVDLGGIEAGWTEWQSETALLIAGFRGPETVIARIEGDQLTELWSTTEYSIAGPPMNVAGIGGTQDCAFIVESFAAGPKMILIRDGEQRTIRDLTPAAVSLEIGPTLEASIQRWEADDGLSVDGWLLRPTNRDRPLPTIMLVHGGPISNWRQFFLGRPRGLALLALLRRGYAIFLPNPRGSSGRGQAYARLVMGDVGGDDALDCLAGLDRLVSLGISDPARLGISGISYGGYLAAWLSVQDPRFAAAVPVAPISNWVTEHLLSNLSHFVASALGDCYRKPGGRYFERSPIMYVGKTSTPTLTICGALDRCTPPAEATQFHRALLEEGVPSMLVTYPQEGHGIRNFPAVIDYSARLVAWFEQHMPSDLSRHRA